MAGERSAGRPGPPSCLGGQRSLGAACRSPTPAASHCALLVVAQVMHKTWNGGKPTPAFNNAAQVVNHTFFWESMTPNGGGEQAEGRLPGP